MELRDYVRVLRKQWILILLCTALAVASAALLTARSTPQYRTSVGFFVSTSDGGANASSSSAYTGSLFSQQRVKSYASIVAGPKIADRVAQDLGGQYLGTVEGRITAAAVPDTVLLNVTVTDPSPQRALSIAQSVARLFPQVADDLEKAEVGDASTVKVSVIQDPRLPTTAFSPRPVRNIGLALVLGLLLGIGLAVLREALDNTVKNPDDVLAATGAATLGAITFDPNASKRPLIVQDSPQSPKAEAFRQLRTNLQFIEIDEPLRSITLTSSVPKEGKSTTACNLALTLAQAGVKTVLIEGDLRRPRIADYLGIEGAVGLTSVLIGKVSLEDALQSFGDGTLQVLASGPLPPNPSELLASRGMRDLIAKLETEYEMVIIDAPPLLPVTDAAVLSTMTSGAVMGVKCRSTRRDQLRKAAEALNAVDGKILGVVLNMVPRRGPDAYYNYGGYGYGYGAYSQKSYGSNPDKARMSDEDAALAIRSSSQLATETTSAGAPEAASVPFFTEPALPEAQPLLPPDQPAQQEQEPAPLPEPVPESTRPGPPVGWPDLEATTAQQLPMPAAAESAEERGQEPYPSPKPFSGYVPPAAWNVPPWPPEPTEPTEPARQSEAYDRDRPESH